MHICHPILSSFLLLLHITGSSSLAVAAGDLLLLLQFPLHIWLSVSSPAYSWKKHFRTKGINQTIPATPAWSLDPKCISPTICSNTDQNMFQLASPPSRHNIHSSSVARAQFFDEEQKQLRMRTHLHHATWGQILPAKTAAIQLWSLGSCSLEKTQSSLLLQEGWVTADGWVFSYCFG